MKSTPLLLAAAAIGAFVAPAPALSQPADAGVLQLYSYRLADAPRFREGYRAHLRWHAQARDRLVWYAWTVQSGPRKGLFIDGTAGATLAGLDARPDLAGDAADSARNLGDSAQAMDIETWSLLPGPSTATPLEARRPGKAIDAFLLAVPPGRALGFEQALANLARQRRPAAAPLSWYRRMRGGAEASYMLLVTRDTWAEIEAQGATLGEILARAYAAPEAAVTAALAPIETLATETWTYESRLSLIPGEPLAP